MYLTNYIHTSVFNPLNPPWNYSCSTFLFLVSFLVTLAGNSHASYHCHQEEKLHSSFDLLQSNLSHIKNSGYVQVCYWGIGSYIRYRSFNILTNFLQYYCFTNFFWVSFCRWRKLTSFTIPLHRKFIHLAWQKRQLKCAQKLFFRGRQGILDNKLNQK